MGASSHPIHASEHEDRATGHPEKSTAEQTNRLCSQCSENISLHEWEWIIGPWYFKWWNNTGSTWHVSWYSTLRKAGSKALHCTPWLKTDLLTRSSPWPDTEIWQVSDALAGLFLTDEHLRDLWQKYRVPMSKGSLWDSLLWLGLWSMGSLAKIISLVPCTITLFRVSWKFTDGPVRRIEKTVFYYFSRQEFSFCSAHYLSEVLIFLFFICNLAKEYVPYSGTGIITQKIGLYKKPSRSCI